MRIWQRSIRSTNGKKLSVLDGGQIPSDSIALFGPVGAAIHLAGICSQFARKHAPSLVRSRRQVYTFK